VQLKPFPSSPQVSVKEEGQCLQVTKVIRTVAWSLGVGSDHRHVSELHVWAKTKYSDGRGAGSGEAAAG
jgi:hypothetical protein